jgi:hypothetical protein
VSSPHAAIAALGINEVWTGYEGCFLIRLGAGLEGSSSLWLKRECRVVDFIAPLARTGEENGNAVAQTI